MQVQRNQRLQVAYRVGQLTKQIGRDVERRERGKLAKPLRERAKSIPVRVQGTQLAQLDQTRRQTRQLVLMHV